jgi:hypothetical protein
VTRSTISLPENLHDDAKSRADSFGLNFSEYVQLLIREDLRSGRQKIMLIAETPGSGAASSPKKSAPVSYRPKSKR